jgi:hypothetical protein
MRIIGLVLGLVLGLVMRADAQSVDSLDDVSAWRAVPASGVEMRISVDTGGDGKVMRVDFDFHGGGGWAAFRRELPISLPDNYEISFWLKGEAPRNTLELKLVDDTGDNVWWVNRPEFEYQGDWRRVTFRKRHITFAWGPKGGGDIRDVAAIEFAITAGTGGKGTIWLDDLTILPLLPVRPYAGDAAIRRTRSTYTLDLKAPQEYGGVVVEWKSPGSGRDYDVQISADARTWQTIRRVRGGRRAKDMLQLPETESAHLRVVVLPGDSAANIESVRIMPLEFGAARNRIFEEIAKDAGDAYPRYFRNTQTYWTIVGNPGARREAMINEYGAVEIDKRSFTLEPFLHDGARMIGWSAADTTALERNDLPIPSAIWQGSGLGLRTTAWTDSTALWLRYRVTNWTPEPRPVTLYVAMRPFQVNPPTQFLNTPGGATRITRMRFDGARVHVDSSTVVPVNRPAGFGAVTFDQGDITDYLRRDTLPGAAAVTDSAESLASGALAYELALPALGTKDIYLAVPFDTADAHVGVDPEARLAATIAKWREHVDRFEVSIPAAPDIGASLRSNLAYILINQDGPAIQPGSRSYERSWIRDGSLTSAALLRLGHAETVKQFIEWYAPFQYVDGKVPCCVDHRGADPVPENDSHGQLIYLIAEYFRYTGDTATVQKTWQHVERAVAYMDSLRNSRRTPEYRGTGFWGMLPQSISHEGYSAKPMHSYWDDFFALKGFKDAVWIAQALGRTGQADIWSRIRDEFNADLVRSFEVTMRNHQIDYLPGSVEVGDFDATSTTVGINPAGAHQDLPLAALRRTFDRYWEDFVPRRANWEAARATPDTTSRWNGYTPYEWRVVGAFVRLGERKRAHEVMTWFMQHQRPNPWNHWAEVVYRNPLEARFIGDMPHTWVGSDFIRSVLDMFVYDDAGRVIIGAGIAPEWVASAADTTVIRNIRTPYGAISYRVFTNSRTNEVHFLFDDMPSAPPNGFVIRSAYDRPITGARAEGGVVPHTSSEVRLQSLPRELVLSY